MNYPTLHHYSKQPVHSVGSIAPIHPQGKHQCGAHKPLGFWVSDDSDFGWAEWCAGQHFGAGKRPKFPRYRAEKMQDFFIISERCVRGFNYVYRNTGMGRFATREEAQAAIPTMVRR